MVIESFNMLESNRRGTLFVYFLLAVMILTLIFSSAVVPPVGAALLVGYFAFVLFTARSLQLPRMPERQRPMQITGAAQRAKDRAPGGSSFLTNPYLLQDIGVIIDERRRDGVALRRARFISLDDESLRPYIVLHYPQSQYPQQVMVRFELTDSQGEARFIYEMDHWLRPGENLILPDYRLPLKGNNQLENTGNWDYTISIDGNILGVHQFNLLPSVSERVRKAGTDGEVDAVTRLQMEEQDEALPLSLEELLSSRQSGS